MPEQHELLFRFCMKPAERKITRSHVHLPSAGDALHVSLSGLAFDEGIASNERSHLRGLVGKAVGCWRYRRLCSSLQSRQGLHEFGSLIVI